MKTQISHSKFKKLICCFLSIVVISTLLYLPVNANEVNYDNTEFSYYRTYTSLYLEKVAHYNAKFVREDVLYDCHTKLPTAIIYTLESGYAIFMIEGAYVCEYSETDPNPYQSVQKDSLLYYAGPFEYLVYSNNHFINILTNETFVPTESKNSFILNEQSSLIAETNIQDKIDALNNNSVGTTRAVTQSKKLPRALSTSWINGYCGPTSAYNMLKYRNLVESGYTGTQLINRISTYTGTGVSLSSLKNGINNYLSDKINTSVRVSSCNYSFSKVVSEINAGRPLTLGTNGGGLATGGHVQTIHGYHRESVGTGTIEYFTLYVNNSWGSNNVAIAYEDSAPSYLKDHVYFLQ